MIARLFLIFSYKINFIPFISLIQSYSGLSNDASFQSGSRDWEMIKSLPFGILCTPGSDPKGFPSLPLHESTLSLTSPFAL